MKRKSVYYVCMFLLIGLLAAGLKWTDSPQKAAWNIHSLVASAEDSPYRVQFALNRRSLGAVNCYLPQYQSVDVNALPFYAGVFGMPKDCEEAEDFYIFSGSEGTLTVDKHLQRLRYEASGSKTLSAENAPPYDDADIIGLASDFFEERFLLLLYEEARVDFDGSRYTVTFIDRIGNLKNYAFNSKIQLNQQGRVLQADYYFLKYERLNTCKIKSMRDAFGELPGDLPEDAFVNLDRCQLVYTYANSIIQPAYLFEGETSEGQAFSCWVNAAIYQ